MDTRGGPAGADIRPAEATDLAGRVRAAAGGRGGALVLTGEVGIGKSTLLRLAAEEAGRLGVRVLRTEGLRAEADLPFGALQRLLPPDLTAAPLPPALAAALDPADHRARPGDRFGPGAGLLSVLTEAAAARPLLVVVDDQQWLDPASARTIGFVARRVEGHPVLVVLARRDGDGTAAPEGVEELRLRRLDADRSLALLEALGIDDPAVRRAIAEDADGNPLALATLARRGIGPGRSAVGAFPLVTGAGPPAGAAVDGEERTSPASAFAPDVAALGEPTRVALAVAGAVGAVAAHELDAVLARLDVGRADLGPAVDAGLLTTQLPAALAFAHPLVRQEAWEQVGPEVRRRIHLAVSVEAADPDRAAWHLAFAQDGPHEPAAAALEAAGQRATLRGAPAVAHRALATAAELSPDPADAARRSIAAAEAAIRAGLPDVALDQIGDLHPPSPQARARLARIQIRASGRADASLRDRIAAAAEGAAAGDPALAAELYCDLAVRAVADLDGARATALAQRACDLTGSLPGPHADRASVLLGLGRLLSGRTESGTALLRRWEGALADGTDLGPLLDAVATALRWQAAFDEGRALAAGVAARARAEGRVEDLALALSHLASIQVLQCDLEEADLHAAEAVALAEATGQSAVRASALLSRAAVAVVRREPERAEALFERIGGSGDGAPSLARLNVAAWRAELALDDGRPADALALVAPFHAQRGAGAAIWLGDSVEALVELGRSAEAAELVATVGPGLRRSGHRRSAAMAARSAGLVAATREEVDARFAEAVELTVDPAQPHPWIKAHLGWARRLLDLGDPKAAAEHATAALAESRRVGAVGLGRRAERLLAAARVAAGSAGAGTGPGTKPDADRAEGREPAATGGAHLDRPARHPAVRLHVLGRFSLLVDGTERPVTGRPATALQLLALHPNGLHVEELAERLWPDAAPGAGRQRLRNVLSRIRAAGIEVVRHEGDLLALPTHVVVDARRFEADARAALAAGDVETRADLLRAAIASYQHPLLPGARYEPWAAAPRERLRTLALEVVERAVDDLAALGSDRAVVELCLLAEELEPLDERWPMRVAEAELAAGHLAAARRAVERTRAVLADLGVAPGAELLDLEARLAARS